MRVKIGRRHNRIQGSLVATQSKAAINAEEIDGNTILLSDVIMNFVNNALNRNEVKMNQDDVSQPMKMVIGADASVDHNTIGISGITHEECAIKEHVLADMPNM